MTAEAVVLLMAGDAAFQVLSGRLGVAENPKGLTVVEWGHQAAFAPDTRS